MYLLLPEFTSEIYLISINHTLEKKTGFRLVTEQNTVLRLPSLSTGMELCQDILMKFLSLHSVDRAQDHTWHWKHLCGKQIRDKKGQNYDPKQVLVSNVRTLSSFMHAIKTNVLIHLQKLIQVITIFLLSILSFDSLIATAFLLAIIGTFLSRSPYF